MYRWRSTYVAAATTHKQYMAYSMELKGAQAMRLHHWFAAVVCKMEMSAIVFV